jgi:hypothetical protein
VLNRVGRRVIAIMRVRRPEYIFVYRGRPIETRRNTTWQKSRARRGGIAATP